MTLIQQINADIFLIRENPPYPLNPRLYFFRVRPEAGD